MAKKNVFGKAPKGKRNNYLKHLLREENMFSGISHLNIKREKSLLQDFKNEHR